MCTYNGSKHIKEQLESIIYQTRKPDEIIICDDCSSDNTVEIAQNLLSVSTIKSTIIRNEINLGFRKNFEKAIGLCHGDIVFLSDQDDVWLPEKIEKVANIFDNDEEVIMAFHDACLVDGNLHPLYPSFWKILRFNYEDFLANNFNILGVKNVVQGSACAFKKELYDEAKPFSTIAFHDEWLGLIAILFDKVVPVNYCMMKYRQENNVVGGVPKTIKEKVILWTNVRKKLKIHVDGIEKREAILSEVISRYPKRIAHASIDIKKYLDFFHLRASYIKSNCFFGIVKMSFVFYKCYQSPLIATKELAKDLMASTIRF